MFFSRRSPCQGQVNKTKVILTQNTLTIPQWGYKLFINYMCDTAHYNPFVLGPTNVNESCKCVVSLL